MCSWENLSLYFLVSYLIHHIFCYSAPYFLNPTHVAMVGALHMYLPTLMVIGTHIPFNTPQQFCTSSLTRVPCGLARESREQNCWVTGHALTIKCTPPASSQLTQFLEGSWGKSVASWDHVAWHPPCGLAQILLLGLRAVGGLLEGGLCQEHLAEFPVGPMVRMLLSPPRPRFSPWSGNQNPTSHMVRPKTRTKQANKRAPCDYKTLRPAASPMACSTYLHPASPRPGWSMTCPCSCLQESLWF